MCILRDQNKEKRPEINSQERAGQIPHELEGLSSSINVQQEKLKILYERLHPILDNLNPKEIANSEKQQMKRISPLAEALRDQHIIVEESIKDILMILKDLAI